MSPRARNPSTNAVHATRSAVGPILNGLFGRKSGTIAGYNYSEAGILVGL
eukprot:NODE_7608_length_197_cov_3.412162_g7163_i0.p3 GENE.NODE_7608_length_197_cov_3.412162_g7163_i0~~NODE_7608_length_197_cov_3.412162_g7163_i0.p3  ORF type:complete len:50 (+),score=0.54 NODE_7608_length_197_cov_3.412162_g7163_i0:43-192(+)